MTHCVGETVMPDREIPRKNMDVCLWKHDENANFAAWNLIK